MPRFGATRTIAAVFGLTAGVAFAAGSSPAHAVHITIDDDLGPSGPALVAIGEPIHITGDTDLEDDGVSFTHTFDFGFALDESPLPGGASVTPNFLRIGTETSIAGFLDFDARVTGPGGIDEELRRDMGTMEETPRINRRSAEFAAIDTGGDTPYTLIITGTLLDGVNLGNYTGNIGVTPLPGAALLFLSALGGLIAVRRYRQTAAPA